MVDFSPRPHMHRDLVKKHWKTFTDGTSWGKRAEKASEQMIMVEWCSTHRQCLLWAGWGWHIQVNVELWDRHEIFFPQEQLCHEDLVSICLMNSFLFLQATIWDCVCSCNQTSLVFLALWAEYHFRDYGFSVNSTPKNNWIFLACNIATGCMCASLIERNLGYQDIEFMLLS